MSDLPPPSKRVTTVIRWIARISGSLFIVVFLAFSVPEWVQKGTISIPSDRIPMVLSLYLVFLGLIIAWKWEGLGGIVALSGVLVYCILGLQTDVKPGATILLTAIYALPALLFLVSWWQARRAVSASKDNAS